MNYRIAEIMANQDLGPSGTKIIDIDVTDPISQIVICHQPVGGSNTPVAHPVANIEKIELVDGSEVLYSCTGYQGQALNIFEAPTPQIQEIDHRNGGTPLCYVNLDFGRWLYDPALAFAPARFTNPQLKLTWNEVNYDASCGSHGFTIFAWVFDEKAIEPQGMLMTKEIKSYEPSSGAYEYTDLPTDYPMRKLILKGLKAGAGVRGLIETIRLYEDEGKRVVLDGDIHQLRSVLDSMVGDAVDHIVGNVGTSSVFFFCTASNVFSHVSDGDTAARVIASGLPVGGRFWVIAETGTTGFNSHVQGKNPHGCICIPFGDQADLADWYDVTKVGSLKCRIKGGTSSASGDTVELVTQQLRRY